MKKSVISIVLLIVILVAIPVIILLDSKPETIKQPDGTYISYQVKDPKWEYVKERLFSGNGEAEFAFKINQYNKNTPILISPQFATKQDSLALNEIISELREIIPNKTIDYFKNFSGITYSDFHGLDPNDNYKMINGISHFRLYHSTIHLGFKKGNNTSLFDDIIETVLPNENYIERTNPPRHEKYGKFNSKVWFQFKENLPFNKRKKYIKYELLRTLCYIYPNNSHGRSQTPDVGVFFTPNYIPDTAEFNDKDIFLLQKLYEDDFLEQFKDYLYTHYSWRKASLFLNKSLNKTVVWAGIIISGLLAFVLLFSFLKNRKFKYAFLSYFIPILFIILYLAGFIMLYDYMTNGSNQFAEESGLRILYFYLGAAILAIGFSFFLWLLEKISIKPKWDFSFHLLSKMFFTLLVFNIPILVLITTKQNLSGFLEFYLPMFTFTVFLAIGRGFLIYLNHFSDNLVKEKDVELSRLKEINAQSELKLLQSHINPHFLYNALNSIAGLAHTNADKTEKMALSLSDLFRYSINKKGEKMSTIKEEVTMVENYLDIEKIRFGDRLTFQLDIDKSILDKKIPMYILQPLVENAIKHGISKIRGEAKIALQIIKEENNLFIRVSDNGPDFPKSLISGHGLQTVNDLLRLSYGDNASLTWENAPKKTITINLPLNH